MRCKDLRVEVIRKKCEVFVTKRATVSCTFCKKQISDLENSKDHKSSYY